MRVQLLTLIQHLFTLPLPLFGPPVTFTLPPFLSIDAETLKRLCQELTCFLVMTVREKKEKKIVDSCPCVFLLLNCNCSLCACLVFLSAFLLRITVSGPVRLMATALIAFCLFSIQFSSLSLLFAGQGNPSCILYFINPKLTC